ncbi:MAG: CarD family transcriptional regulator [Oscillospiraceae bacterium]|nr:CarD family transcriptional regulator [Oscillospiraceae bacterium]
MELQIDEYVVYKTAGVCQVLAKESQSPDGQTEILYYKIKPLNDTNSIYYIPVATAEEKLRRLLSKEQVLELIDSMADSEDKETVWSDNRRERKEMYSQIMRGGDQHALVQMISTLYFRKQSSEASGKRFSSMDENAMKNAETLLLQEFGVVLGLEPEEVREYIDRRVKGE